ncbi:MAG: hypothetical protein H7Z41_16405 [Cytophagales bacterium]|nr:hypothetical protein [Armatimonadota bacterium]
MKATMIHKSLISAALLGLTLTVSAAQAAAPPKSVNQRQQAQRDRIQAGRKSGELTRVEAERLRARQAQTRRQEARYRASGDKLTAAERAKLQRELNEDAKVIRNQKTDAQDR